MKFQKKIVFNFLLFSTVVVTLLIIGYGYFSYKDLKKTEYENLRIVATTKASQFDDMLNKMDNVSLYLLSDQEFLDATVALSRSNRHTYEGTYFNQATTSIRNALNNYYFMKQFNRVIYFNENNLVIGNNNFDVLKLNTAVTSENIDWLEHVKNKAGDSVVIPIHRDDWSYYNNFEVISLVMEVQKENRGFIEVQQRKTDINIFLKSNAEAFEFIVLDKESKEPIYLSDTKRDIEPMTIDFQEGISFYKSVNSAGNREVIYAQYIFDEKLIFMTIKEFNVKEQILYNIVPLMAIIVIVFFVFVFAYIYTTSHRLTAPIKKLQHIMEKSSGENFDIDLSSKIASNDEIEVLYEYYINILKKQQEAIMQEKKLSMLQLKAQFDLLQAQVNPHFLYNVLNVISNRGVLSDDEIICDICSDLADMLRYSTNTKEEYATVDEELKYLERYLSLLKYRYEHRLLYNIRIDEQVRGEILPKIILQQIIENSIVHGYGNSNNTIEIEIAGVQNESGWEIVISDKGEGILPSIIEKIYQSFDEVRNSLSTTRTNVEMQIGGMGLVNVYARLFLLYNDVYIRIISEVGSGTDVIIGVNKTYNESLDWSDR